jgi:exosome complex component RRP42
MAVSISGAEREFIIQGVELNIRSDGRSRLDYRHFTLETGVNVQCNGSARVKLENTDIIAGVRIDLTEPHPYYPDEGVIRVSVECSPSASSSFKGREGEDLSLQLSRVLLRSLGRHSLDMRSLCVIPGKLVWALHIDALVMDSSGNLFDTLSIAVRAALYDTRIPKVIVEDDDVEVSDDVQDCTRLDVTNVPIAITLTKIGSRFIVDSTLEEEQCMGVRLVVAVNQKASLCSIQMGGHGGIEPTSLTEMLQTAQRLGIQIIDGLDKALKEEEKLLAQRPTSTAKTFFT